MGSSYLSRRQYAKDSMQFNRNNPLFRELFKKQQVLLHKTEALAQSQSKDPTSPENKQNHEKAAPKESYAVYLLYLLLILLVGAWASMKGS